MLLVVCLCGHGPKSRCRSLHPPPHGELFQKRKGGRSQGRNREVPDRSIKSRYSGWVRPPASVGGNGTMCYVPPAVCAHGGDALVAHRGSSQPSKNPDPTLQGDFRDLLGMMRSLGMGYRGRRPVAETGIIVQREMKGTVRCARQADSQSQTSGQIAPSRCLSIRVLPARLAPPQPVANCGGRMGGRRASATWLVEKCKSIELAQAPGTRHMGSWSHRGVIVSSATPLGHHHPCNGLPWHTTSEMSVKPGEKRGSECHDLSHREGT